MSFFNRRKLKKQLEHLIPQGLRKTFYAKVFVEVCERNCVISGFDSYAGYFRFKYDLNKDITQGECCANRLFGQVFVDLMHFTCGKYPSRAIMPRPWVELS